jgi:predicted acylesterase/phospholipase RssA
MIVYTLPVSGGSFPFQIRALIELSEEGWKPDVLFATSGGNVSAYLGLTANFEAPALRRLLKEINSDLFIQRNADTPSLDAFTRFFKGCLYNPSTKLGHLLQKYHNQDTIQRYEIWTGTYNRSTQKALFCCNCSEQRSRYQHYTPNHTLFQTEDLTFLQGSLDSITKIILASASIPVYLPPQKFQGADLVDGGIAYASPLPIFASSLSEEEELILFYCNGVNLADQDNFHNNNIIDNVRLTTTEMSKFNICRDRQLAYQTVFGFAQVPYQELSLSTLPALLSYLRQKKVARALIEFYPLENQELPIQQFQAPDVQELLAQPLGLRFWTRSEFLPLGSS